MIPVRDILIKVDKAYKTEIKTDSGFTLLLDQNIKQVKDTIRYGQVVAVPEGLKYDIQVGDTLFFHHGIVNVTIMDNMPDIQSPYLVDGVEHLYRVPVDERMPLMYAVVRNGDFKCLPHVCFIRPKKTKKYDTFLYIPGNEKEIEQVGEVVYCGDNLLQQGVDIGDTVIFKRNSEYQFTINDETLYCMTDKKIYAVYED